MTYSQLGAAKVADLACVLLREPSKRAAKIVSFSTAESWASDDHPDKNQGRIHNEPAQSDYWIGPPNFRADAAMRAAQVRAGIEA